MTILIVVGIVVGTVLLLGLCIWAVAAAFDSTVKDYIDYARKEKDDVRHRRT